MEVSETQRLRPLEDENSRLKRLVADLILNREMLKLRLQKTKRNLYPHNRTYGCGPVKLFSTQTARFLDLTAARQIGKAFGKGMQ